MIDLPDELVIGFPGMRHARRVRGLIIGAILVRATFPDEHTADCAGFIVSAANRWAVDHHLLPGARYCDVASLSIALLLADELSRFAPGDIEGVRTVPELGRAVGPELGRWIGYVCDVDAEIAVDGCGLAPMDFRAWCAAQGLPVPRARARELDACGIAAGVGDYHDVVPPARI